ncbi:ATP-binding protein [Shewanella waksmanii]|uniref:ATP-binding protein n=1 Tax=Shewanella waksmanii TaxID=213783 RepID=UPI0037351541
MQLNNAYRAGEQLALLWTMGLVLKLCLTFIFADTFGLSLHSPLLNLTLLVEAIYLAVVIWHRDRLLSSDKRLFFALAIDSCFWISWLYFSGGATNAFISLLLMPIAISAILLPYWAPWTLAAISTLAYSVMVFSIPESSMHHHGMDMGSHYLGMWFNFVISSLVLTTTVAYIAKRMRRQDAELAYMREAQLRQEKLLALGTASAQMAHQLATPLASLRLLIDELSDDLPKDDPMLADMNAALGVCEKTLADLRQATESIRQSEPQLQAVEALTEQLREQVALLMPQVQLQLTSVPQSLGLQLSSDASLLPALLSLIENGARASFEKQGQYRVEVELSHDDLTQQLLVVVKDFGAGIPKGLLNQLGHNIVEKPKGMGIALMLSHSSFERLGGRLLLSSHQQGGTLAQVELPVWEN